MHIAIAVLFALVTAFANGAVADSREELEAQIREHQSKRQDEMEKFLSVFHVDSLTLGKAEWQPRCCKESYGVYVGGRHLNDVYSGGYKFTKYELADSVYTVLMDARLIDSSFSFVTPSISPEADSLLRSWGGGVVIGNDVYFGHVTEVLTFDANTKSASIRASGDVVIVDVINHDGSRAVATVVRGIIVVIREIPQP